MESNKEPKAKKTSLNAMIFSVVWVALHAVAKGILAAFNRSYLSVNDIILTGVFIAGAFSPVIVSVWLDKLIQLRNGTTPPEGEK